MRRTCPLLVAMFALVAGCAKPGMPAGPVVVPRAASAPTLDGKLDDACWKNALTLNGFSLALTDRWPSKATTARLVFDDDALYVAVECAEPDPSSLRANVTVENDDVWSDDSVQVFLRAREDYLHYDQFEVNSTGVRGWNFPRAAGQDDRVPAFRVKAAKAKRAWAAEFAILFADLGLAGAPAGRAVELKIGRFDAASRPVQADSWPPGARFSGPEDFAVVYLGAAGAAPARRSVEAVGPAIPVAPGEPVVIRKLLVKDCRAVRGFIGHPVDGSTESWDWDARFYEYNRGTGGSGVEYDYRNNDGLHIKLADAGGFDAIQIRGGARTKIYRDASGYGSPEGGALLATLPGGTQGTSRVLFDAPVKTDAVSFFDTTDGFLSDVSFFRVTRDGPAPGGERRRVKAPGDVVSFDTETPLAAVGFDLWAHSPLGPLPVTVTLVDPVDPRRDLFVADLEVARGTSKVILDFPDQIVPAGATLKLKFVLHNPGSVRLDAVDLYMVPREAAAPEALAYRKLILHALYSSMSEPRPWNVWHSRALANEFLASDNRRVPGVKNILDALESCRAIDRDGKDDEVRQYYEWIWRWTLKKEGKLPDFTPKIDDVAGLATAEPGYAGAKPGAPRWAVLARQAWLSARAVPKWWLDHRLVPTGELGGEVGDDTDMYQNWADFPMLESDGVGAEIKAAGARLAALAQRSTMTAGVNRRTTDPLHAYEEGLNHDALMAFWFYGDPVYLERCMDSARSMEKLTVVTPAGHRHFRSQDIGFARLDDPRTDVDGHAHPLMWHPTFELVRYNNNPAALRWLREWADGWLAHMQPGKYASSVDVATEKVTMADNEAFAGGYGGQGSAFESMYWITGDEKYIAPFVETYAKTGRDKATPGRMIAELYQRGALKPLGDKLPALLAEDPAAPAPTFGDTSKLEKALEGDIAELQRFPMFFTTVEPFTDRVFLYAITNAAKCYTGGFATRNKYCRTHAVSWEGLGTDYAAMVTVSRPNRFMAQVYNFSDNDRTGQMRFWTLEHGTYRLMIQRGENLRREDVEIQRATALKILLPFQSTTLIQLEQIKKLDDERERPDLALSPLDTKLSAGSVESVVHNIGSKDVADVVVALVYDKGVVRQKKSLGPLAAPNDCVPKRIPFRFDNVPIDPRRRFVVIVDPDDKVEEIYEGNNRVEFR